MLPLLRVICDRVRACKNFVLVFYDRIFPSFVIFLLFFCVFLPDGQSVLTSPSKILSWFLWKRFSFFCHFYLVFFIYFPFERLFILISSFKSFVLVFVKEFFFLLLFLFGFSLFFFFFFFFLEYVQNISRIPYHTCALWSFCQGSQTMFVLGPVPVFWENGCLSVVVGL